MSLNIINDINNISKNNLNASNLSNIANITVQENTKTVKRNENIIGIDGGNLIEKDCVEIIEKEEIIQGNNVNLSGIHKLSESVAFLCVGFTGAEMKLLMKRTILTCFNSFK